MSDYIKREDAIKAFDPSQRRDWYTPWIVETLKDLPSADVAPIMHGKWVEDYNEQEPAGFKLRWRCTACDNWQTYGQTFFCPYCGARMVDGGGTDADRID